METKNNIIVRRVNGLIQMIVSILFFLYHADLLYAYKFILAEYYFMYPNWVLIINIVLGVLGFLIGLKTYRNKIKIRNGYLWILLLVLGGSLLDILSVI